MPRCLLVNPVLDFCGTYVSGSAGPQTSQEGHQTIPPVIVRKISWSITNNIKIDFLALQIKIFPANNKFTTS